MGKQQYVPFDVVVELNCNGFGRRSPVVVVVGVGVGGDVDDVVVVVVGADDPWAGARGAKQEVVGEGGTVGGGKEEVRGIPATEGRAWGKHRAGHPLFLSLQFCLLVRQKVGYIIPCTIWESTPQGLREWLHAYIYCDQRVRILYIY